MDPHATVFDGAGYQAQGWCPSSYATPLRACVYSPSGFANGSDDIELWVRDPSGDPHGGVFAKAASGAVGTYVYRIASYEFDQQFVADTTPGSTATVTFDGTYDVDDDPVLVEHDLGATPCAYPELS